MCYYKASVETVPKRCLIIFQQITSFGHKDFGTLFTFSFEVILVPLKGNMIYVCLFLVSMAEV